jgi:hypothetical protein
VSRLSSRQYAQKMPSIVLVMLQYVKQLSEVVFTPPPPTQQVFRAVEMAGIIAEPWT